MKINSLRRPLASKAWTTYLAATLIFFGPRLAAMLWWLVDPVRWRFAFNGAPVLPLLGCLVLPWTTATVVLVAVPGGLVNGDWVWVGVALLLDILWYDRAVWTNPTVEEPG